MANLSERLRDLADEGELIHLYPHDLLCRRLREAATILDRLQSLSDQNRLTGGWRAVPEEPTPVMLEAGCDAAWPGLECVYDDAHDGPEAMLCAGWKAMLAACTENSNTAEEDAQ